MKNNISIMVKISFNTRRAFLSSKVEVNPVKLSLKQNMKYDS